MDIILPFILGIFNLVASGINLWQYATFSTTQGREMYRYVFVLTFIIHFVAGVYLIMGPVRLEQFI